jgi:uncharacterized protein YndB with AHSA1/START domain
VTQVEAEAHVAAAPERVFRALTDAKELERWFCDAARSEPSPGGELWMRWTGPGATPEAYEGRWMIVDPPRLLAYQGGHAGYPDGDAGRVEIALHAEAGGTRVRVRHTFPPGAAHAAVAERYHGIWPRTLEKLRAHCASLAAPPARAAWVLAAAAFVLSLLVMPATPGVGDSAEFTLALALAGLPHPTGYPIYVMLGHAFVKLFHAAGMPWVLAANLWSAVGAAVAVGLYARIAQRLAAALGGNERERNVAAVMPVLLLVLNPAWTVAATQAEVYSWWYAWLAGAALYALAWMSRLAPADAAQAPPDAERRDLRSALVWGLLCGLGLAHHLMSAIFVVPLSIGIAAAARAAGRWRAALLGWVVLGAVPALAAYAFVAFRVFHPAAFQWPAEPNAAGVWNHVRGAAYAHYVGGFAPNPWQSWLLGRAILPLAIVGIASGAFWALRVSPLRLRAWLLGLLAAAAGLAAFVLNYRVPDPALFLVPTLIAGNLMAAPAMSWLARRARPEVALALVLAVAVSLGAWTLERGFAERRRLGWVEMNIRGAWRSLRLKEGIVLWNDDHSTRLRLFQLLEGERPQLYVENTSLLTWGPARRRFIERFGFDPLEGLELRRRQDVALIPENIRRRTTLPVVDFPEVIEAYRARR